MYTRKIRATGETLTVARPDQVQADPEGGKWVTICEDHKSKTYSATEKLAYYKHGADFCEGCRKAQAPEPAAEAPAKKTAAI
jgi:hypothetical protein